MSVIWTTSLAIKIVAFSSILLVKNKKVIKKQLTIALTYYSLFIQEKQTKSIDYCSDLFVHLNAPGNDNVPNNNPNIYKPII